MWYGGKALAANILALKSSICGQFDLKTVSARMACGAQRAVGEDARARQALKAFAQAPAHRFRVTDFPTKYVGCRLAVIREVPVHRVVFEIAKDRPVARLWALRAGGVVGGAAALAFW